MACCAVSKRQKRTIPFDSLFEFTFVVLAAVIIAFFVEEAEAKLCPVAIVDLGREVAQDIGVPLCDLADPAHPAAQARTYQITKKGMRIYEVHHERQQPSVGSFLATALRSSPAVPLTSNWDEACLIYAEFHCYYMWWQWEIAAPPGEYGEPMWYMARMLKELHRRTSPSQRRKLVVTWPSPMIPPLDSVCPFIGEALQVVLERATLCTAGERSPEALARTEWEQGVLMPYNANADVDAVIEKGNGSADAPRSIFLSYYGAGGDKADHLSAGKHMRHDVINQGLLLLLTGDSNPDVRVHNSCWGCTGQASHAEAVHAYGSSKYCLVLAGDTQSTLRASEVVLHGCVPVLVGPPFNTLPLHHAHGGVPWREFAIFLRVVDTSGWSGPKGSARYNETRDWALPYHDADKLVVEVGDVAGVLPALRALHSDEALSRRQAAMQPHRRAMVWATQIGGGGENGRGSAAVGAALSGGKSAADLVIERLVDLSRRRGTAAT